MAHSGGLKRLEKLFVMMEDLRALQMRVATGAVVEVDRALTRLSEVQEREGSEARVGLEQGSRVELMAAEESAAKEKERRELLLRLREERVEARDAAAEAHRESRVELRQVEGIVERRREQQAMLDGRREQNASDDRFLARRAWLEARAVQQGMDEVV